jgi:hypothetical protein
VPSSHASQTMTSTTDLEVGANFPFAGPVNLGLVLQKHGKITVEYHSIGEYRLALDRAAAEDLTGDCSGATHIIASMSVGAFEFFAGDAIGANAEANVPTAAGVTAGGNRSHENLDRGGDPAACDAASRKSTEPPDRCDSVVAIELMALERNSPFVVGERWEGHYECGRRKATSAFEITELADDGTVDGVIHFDYADVVGEFVARGKPDAAGAMTLTFVEWRKQPAGYDPITPSGAVDAARGEFRGKLSEPGCGDFVYVRRPAG